MIIIAALAFMGISVAFVATVHLSDRRKLRAFSSSSFVAAQHSATAPRLAFTMSTGKGVAMDTDQEQIAHARSEALEAHRVSGMFTEEPAKSKAWQDYLDKGLVYEQVLEEHGLEPGETMYEVQPLGTREERDREERDRDEGYGY